MTEASFLHSVKAENKELKNKTFIRISKPNVNLYLIKYLNFTNPLLIKPCENLNDKLKHFLIHRNQPLNRICKKFNPPSK